MPVSTTSFWSRLFPWLRRSTTSVAPTTTTTNTSTGTPSSNSASATPIAPPSVPDAPLAPTNADVLPSSVPTAPEPSLPLTPASPTPQPVLITPTLPAEGVNLGFARLWQNHPAIKDGDVFPCKDEAGNANFGNQCGIMMGTCLLRSGLLHGYDKSVCWYRGHQGHTLRAREVADWMRRHPERFGRVEIRKNVTWGAFKGRTGLVCFHNFWGEGNQGDHIDLWDGTGLVRRAVDPSLEGAGMAHGSLDYFERAEEVWFWAIY